MTYPKYYKTSAHQIKVINSRSELWVTSTKTEERGFSDLQHLEDLKATESTEQEFKAAFNKTSKYLKSLI